MNQGGYPGANAQEPDPLSLLATDVLRTAVWGLVAQHLAQEKSKVTAFSSACPSVKILKTEYG